MLAAFLIPLTGYVPALAGFVSLILGVGTLAVLVVEIGWVRKIDVGQPQTTLIYFGQALLVVPVIFFIFSRVIIPIWVARYMMPSLIGLGIVATDFADRKLRSKVWGAAIPMILMLPIASAYIAPTTRLDIARVDGIVAGEKLPMVEGAHSDFFIMQRYSRDAAQNYYLLDWDAALHTARSAPTEFHLMQNYRDVGYLTGSIKDIDEFLRENRRFLVLDNSNSSWFFYRLKSHPEWRWRVIAELDKGRRVIEVQQ